MTLSVGDQAAIYGVGVAATLVFGGAISRSALIKGETHSRWNKRVGFATTALREKTIRELEELRDELNTMLPDPGLGGAPFDPDDVNNDPGPLSERAARTVRFHSARLQMKSDLTRLRALGRIFVFAFSVLAIACLVLTAFYGQLLKWPALEWIGIASLAVGFAVLLPCGARYVVLNDRLATAEILANTDGSDSLSPPNGPRAVGSTSEKTATRGKLGELLNLPRGGRDDA